jgi:hypothetical protein
MFLAPEVQLELDLRIFSLLLTHSPMQRLGTRKELENG